MVKRSYLGSVGDVVLVTPNCPRAVPLEFVVNPILIASGYGEPRPRGKLLWFRSLFHFGWISRSSICRSIKAADLTWVVGGHDRLLLSASRRSGLGWPVHLPSPLLDQLRAKNQETRSLISQISDLENQFSSASLPQSRLGSCQAREYRY
jgi:hypothetical protein